MKALEKPQLRPKDELIQLNGFRNSFSGKKHEQIKSQIDVILQKDYINWRVSANKFDALNSLTAKSSDIIHTYVKGIYSDYQIQDPLEQRNGRLRGLSFANQSFVKNPPIEESKFARDSRFSLDKSPYQPSVNRKLYETPTKSLKKGLELTHSRSSKQKVSILQQLPTPEKIKNNLQNQVTPQKIKFIEKTAPSPDSSFALSNSKNYAWTSTQMGLSAVKNLPTRDSLLFNSKISVENKEPQNAFSAYFLQNKKMSQQNLPSVAEFKSTRQFLNRRKEKDLSIQKQKQLPLIGSEVSLGENNPEREQKISENLRYASYFINAGNKRTLFEPEQSVRESFRYCVGCENAILEVNIRVHEDKCAQFKKILSINNVQEIISQLNKKIERIVKNIIGGEQNISEKDNQNMVKSTNDLSQQVMQKIKKQRAQKILKSQGFMKNYDDSISIGTKWGHLTEQVNKIKWFLLIKRNFEQLKFPNPQNQNLSK